MTKRITKSSQARRVLLARLRPLEFECEALNSGDRASREIDAALAQLSRKYGLEITR